MGVNENIYDKDRHNIISNASCTTNCLAPFTKVINDKFKIKQGLMTTVHAYTNDQNLQDNKHKDIRRARAAALSMIPTSTGAAKAVGLVLPELKGKLDGFAIRVPIPTVSIVDATFKVEKEVSVEEVNKAFEDAKNGDMKGILDANYDKLVSIDYQKSTYSSIVDLDLTKVMGNMVKVTAWYDNEWGYSCRVVDLARYIATK